MPLHRLADLPAESAIGERGTAGRDQFPVEPGRAVAADLLVEIEGREDADGEVAAPVAGIVGHPPLSDVGGDLPAVGVDALDMAGAAQRFQPVDVRTNVGLGIAIDPFQPGAGCFQMHARAIDAGRIRDVADVDIRCPRLVREPPGAWSR